MRSDPFKGSNLPELCPKPRRISKALRETAGKPPTGGFPPAGRPEDHGDVDMTLVVDHAGDTGLGVK